MLEGVVSGWGADVSALPSLIFLWSELHTDFLPGGPLCLLRESYQRGLWHTWFRAVYVRTLLSKALPGGRTAQLSQGP